MARQNNVLVVKAKILHEMTMQLSAALVLLAGSRRRGDLHFRTCVLAPYIQKISKRNKISNFTLLHDECSQNHHYQHQQQMNTSNFIKEQCEIPFSRPTRRRSREICVSPSMKAQCPREFQSTVSDINQALANGHLAVRTTDGSGVAYFLYGTADNDPQGVFKPADEESPKREGIPRGEECVREVAAFELDRDFCGVPATTIVEVRHPDLPSA